MSDRCPTCQGTSRVIDSRHIDGTIRRRRQCLRCRHRWVTLEVMADTMPRGDQVIVNLKDLQTLTNVVERLEKMKNGPVRSR